MSWDDEDFDIPTSNTPVASASWEDEEDDEPLLEESWDVDEDEIKAKKAAEAAAKAAEKQALKDKQAAALAAKKSKKSVDQKMLDIDLVDEKTRREMLKQAQLESDLNSAADLFDGLGVAEHPRERAARLAAAMAPPPAAKLTVDTPLDAHPLFTPTTKQEYEKLRKVLGATLIALSEESLLNYTSSLAIDLIRDLCQPLSIESIRKVTSTLTVISNDKTRAERQARLAKTNGTATGGAGKKKLKTVKPNVGQFAKGDDFDATNYDDFGDDDFM